MSDQNVSPNNHKSTPTPPKNKKVRNPFDNALIDRLHKPICSPGMCRIYKKKNNGSFYWDIDQACSLVPADIVACNSQFEPSPDPALEKIAEEATEKFFSQEMVMPSPLESSKKVKPLLQISNDSSIHMTSFIKDQMVAMKDVSAQTVLTLPPELPPEIEKILEPFCTFTQEQNISGDYEITANGSLCRKLFFEEHSDMDHYDSEQTDDEIHVERRPPSSYEAHTPVVFSPDLSQDLVTKGMKRTFETPLRKNSSASGKPCYRNKILDVVDFGEPCFSPIQFKTPKRMDQESGTSSSLASTSISPVNKVTSSDEEKNNFTSPESDAMATCLDCIVSDSESDKKRGCFCKTLSKLYVKRSASLKESPMRSRKSSVSFSERRSLSLSSLHRSRSVQKLDFSMDISMDTSFRDHSQDEPSESNYQNSQTTWSLVEETSIQQLVKAESLKNLSKIQSSTKFDPVNILDNTPIKGKNKCSVLSHEISKIRAAALSSPMHMSLDSSLDNCDNPLSMEDKKIDFNQVDLKFLTENVSQYDYSANNATKPSDSSVSFKRVDSGFNENTFYVNASSYYESAIKPSELTVTNVSTVNSNKTALKEISNIPWMRIDSGFNDENSSNNVQFYSNDSVRKITDFHLADVKVDDKENSGTDIEFLVQGPSKSNAMSMSDIFNDDMTFNCNFSSTPSKSKSRKVHS
ncbi:protein aurora borealis [Galleria mellonella]|uniref:Protein aurora borealis n=1 Tax=Galleria mellonella TaxID=7137 RepID=A0A6J1WKB9_GALME|nr:protein aurora borealis [Galleria mellonella]